MTTTTDSIRSFLRKLNQCSGQHQALVAIDAEGIIHFWNNEAEQLLGYTAFEANRKSINSLLCPADAEQNLFKSPGLEKNSFVAVQHKQGHTIRLDCKLAFFNIRGVQLGVYYLNKTEQQPLRAVHDVGTRKGGPLTAEYELLEGSAISNSGSEWLISYLDIMTLVLIFFILAYSMTGGITAKETEALQVEPQQAANTSSLNIIPTGDLRPAPTLIENRKPTPQLNALRSAIKDSDLQGQLDIIDNEQSISLRIKDNILFPPGDAIISERGELFLDELTLLIEQDSYPITIEGHTDSLPINSLQYPSNWELSSARASSVVRLLISNGIAADRLKATGYADTRPLFKSTDAAIAANRRVEIILHVAEQPQAEKD
jgi:chemotaxis protein MotB